MEQEAAPETPAPVEAVPAKVSQEVIDAKLAEMAVKLKASVEGRLEAATEPVAEAESDEDDDAPTDEEILREKKYRYIMAFNRLSTKKIEGLTYDEMLDIACVSKTEAESFREWDAKRFGE